MTPDFRNLNVRSQINLSYASSQSPFFGIQVNPSKIKMPSTPVDSPFDLTADINSPDRQAGPYFLRHQQIKNVLSTAEVLEQQNQRLQKSFKMLNINTPDSSQTDHSSADDVSPKIQRRRKNLIAAAAEDKNELLSKKHNLPKLSISLEHDTPSQLLPSPTVQTSNSSSNIVQEVLNKRVLKSASAIDLSLKIMPNYTAENVRKAKLKLETNFGEFRQMGSDSNLELESSLAKSLNSSGGNGSSTASSREVSPSRDGPLINNLKPP